jgi:hypothetical protein
VLHRHTVKPVALDQPTTLVCHDGVCVDGDTSQITPSGYRSDDRDEVAHVASEIGESSHLRAHEIVVRPPTEDLFGGDEGVDFAVPVDHVTRCQPLLNGEQPEHPIGDLANAGAIHQGVEPRPRIEP